MIGNMNRDIRLSRGNSPYVGSLTKGCRECMKGAKLVLFITGRCPRTCYYCPISENRRDKDVIYANEVNVTKIEEALAEGRMIDATGMGITGGEPLLELKKTCEYIRAFKQEFGPKFHVHLYTGLEPVPLDTVKKLIDEGLDELRLHRFEAGADLPKLRAITQGKIKLGVEIPAIPGKLEKLKQFLQELEQNNIDFVNINEFEFASINAKELQKRGFTLDPDSIAGVKGSEAIALELLEWATENTSLNVHFCPLSLKDGTQLPNRFKRRAKNVVKSFERITNEGLIVKGIIVPPETVTLAEVLELLTIDFAISRDMIWLNNERNQVETSTGIVRRLAKRLTAQGFRVGIIEEYPIEDRFQVSFLPL